MFSNPCLLTFISSSNSYAETATKNKTQNILPWLFNNPNSKHNKNLNTLITNNPQKYQPISNTTPIYLAISFINICFLNLDFPNKTLQDKNNTYLHRY